MKHMLTLFLLFLCSCTTLSDEQRAELQRMSAENTAAATRLQTMAQEIEQARRDFDAGRMTQEQLNGLVLRGQEETTKLTKLIQENAAQASALRAQGVPIGQVFWEQWGATLTNLGLSLAGAYVLAKQGDKKAVVEAQEAVRRERGPIDARRGAPPKAA